MAILFVLEKLLAEGEGAIGMIRWLNKLNPLIGIPLIMTAGWLVANVLVWIWRVMP